MTRETERHQVAVWHEQAGNAYLCAWPISQMVDQGSNSILSLTENL